MSDKRLTTATIDGISYKLGEELNVNLASTDAAGIIKVGTTTNDYKTDSRNYPLGIDNAGRGYVKITDINSSVSNNIGIASSTKPGLVLIPSNSGLKIDPENGSLGINLQTGHGIGISQSDSNNPSYLKLETATSNSLGGIKIGYTNSDSQNNYGVELDNDGKAYVEVPSYRKTIQVFDGTDIELNQDTIFVNLEVGSKAVIIKHLTVDVGKESELIVKGITKLAIDTSVYGENSIKYGLYWAGGKPTFNPDNIYNIKFTKFAAESNNANNKIGKYLVSYTSNYINEQDNSII